MRSRESIQRAALPVVAIVVFAVFVAAAVGAAAAAGTFGYDFLAYHQAAERVFDGQPVYDATVQTAGGFGFFYYPPPFVVAMLPFALLSPQVAVWTWTVLIVVAFLIGVAVMPVDRSVRWTTLLLAGLSWPFAYAIKLGQVGPLLFLMFAIGWRWMDRPRVLGASAAAGALIKIQPGLLILWAALTGRVAAVAVAIAVCLVALVVAAVPTGGLGTWVDFLTLLRNVSDPIATPHNFTPGAIAYGFGADPTVATIIQMTVSVLVVGAVVVSARVATAAASFLVAVVASQLLSPVLWDHYAMLLLLPTAWLLGRGHRWAIAIPLATSTVLLPFTPPVVYPLVFGTALVAVLAVGTSRRLGEKRFSIPEPA